MKTYDKAVYFPNGCAVALGTFDGVHTAHAKVIGAAKNFGGECVVVTFSKLPSYILTGASLRILSPSLRENQFEILGVDAVIYLDFDSVKDMSADAFFNMLKDEIGARAVSCGYNYTFGRAAGGDVRLLSQYCGQSGIDIAVQEKVDGVSSTDIRAALSVGDVKKANALLGHPYAIDFTVAHGEKRGKTLGFPTINQVYTSEYFVPKRGVYVSQVHVGDMVFRGVTNIGNNPTFGNVCDRAETHIIGFDGDLYGEKPEVELLDFIRGEVKFDSEQQLRDAVFKDMEKANNYK